MSVDYYATPADLVTEMIASVAGRQFQTVLDPAAGDGRLIVAAQQRWPKTRAVAVEADPIRAAALVRSHASWRVRCADFLMPDPTWEASVGGPLLVLLNPPFSARGAGAVPIYWPAETPTRCGKAMSFVLKAAQLVDEFEGEVVAIVPRGLLTNTRDSEARELLAGRGALTVVGDSPGYAFRGAAANTAIIRWVAHRRPVTPSRARRARCDVSSSRVIRGALAMHKAKRLAVGDSSADALPLLHTTTISHARGVTPAFYIKPRACERVVSGPCLIVQRVGQPSPDKLVIYTGGPSVLSDCLYAIDCASVRAATRLRAALLADWEGLRSSYGGSCAPFLRLDDLVSIVAGHDHALTNARRPVSRDKRAA